MAVVAECSEVLDKTVWCSLFHASQDSIMASWEAHLLQVLFGVLLYVEAMGPPSVLRKTTFFRLLGFSDPSKYLGRDCSFQTGNIVCQWCALLMSEM